MRCGCIILLTCPPWAPFLMCFCVPLSLGRLGPARAEVGVGFRRVRLVQALPSFPPSASLVPLPVGLSFSFPLPFQGLPVPGQVCRVGVLSVPLLLRSLLRVLVRKCSFHFHCHLTFIFISSAPPRWGVCVYNLNRCKTSYFAGGHRGPGGVGDQRRHLPGTRANVPTGLCVCVKLLYVKFVCEVMVCDKVVCLSECVWIYCMLNLCVRSYGMCVWSYCMLNLCVWVCVKFWYVSIGGRRRKAEEPGIQNQKQEPHTKIE